MDAPLISVKPCFGLAKTYAQLVTLTIFALISWGNTWATADRTPSVLIVKTKSHPRIDAVVAAIATSLADTATVKMFDLRGQASNNDTITRDLSAAVRETSAVLVGIGTPATQLLAREFPDLPLIYTMTRAESIPELLVHNRALPVPAKTSLTAQLTTLQYLVSPLETVGILVGAKTSREFADELTEIESTSLPDIRIVSVEREKDLPRALAELSARVDALLFVQDPSILNRNSLEYIVTHTLAQKKPSMVYSEYLVRAGFLASNLISPESIGERTKATVDQLMTNRTPVPINLHPYAAHEYRIVVNQHTLELLGLAKPALEKIEYFSP